MLFEIITRDGLRFRYNDAEYAWQYLLMPGTIDIEDYSKVEILKLNSNGESESLLYITNVTAVGSLEGDQERFKFREFPIEKCPRCGYGVVLKEE